MTEMAQQAKIASRQVAQLTTTEKNQLLADMADAIEQATSVIIEQNSKDLAAGREKGLSEAMLDRLALDESRIADIAAAIREIISLADPVGRIAHMAMRPNGIQVGKMSIPLGVIAMITKRAQMSRRRRQHCA